MVPVKHFVIPAGRFLKPLNAKDLANLMAKKNPTHSSYINKELERAVTPWYFTEDDILARRLDEGLIIVRLPNADTSKHDAVVAFEAMIQDIREDK